MFGVVIALVLYFLPRAFRPRSRTRNPPVQKYAPPKKEDFRDYKLDELKKYTGNDGGRVMLAARGKVRTANSL